MTKAQIELSMLTRFAMIFFIVSLAALMMGLSNREKAQLCSAQSSELASSIASQVNQVLTSPVEDERKVFPLTASLASGKEEYSRYQIKLTNKPPVEGSTRGYILIEVRPLATTECRTTVPVYYDADLLGGITLAGAGGDDGPLVDEMGESIIFQPSTRSGEPSWFLTILKCKPKHVEFKTQLWIEDCRHENPAQCTNFIDPVIDGCCGWNWVDNFANPQGCKNA
ncbi:hypothetical protein AUJ65_02655 [Candidatus Micrarchaeota archaeon CG1_02_51_15]|nr:MAG: hypothetical protein AUJ65_02655 [Candidatus Micrarchaeota archaeon CG1_02_51_15]